MTKKNMQIAISSLILVGAASFLQAEEAAAQPEALLEYSALGTGEQIREEVMTDEIALQDNDPSDPDGTDEDETPPPPPPKNGKMKKKNGQNGNGKMNGKNNNGNKIKQGSCGEGKCS